MVMKLWLQWRLSRAERALTQSRLRRETQDLENPDYGGLLAEQVVEERLIEQRIADLKQRLEEYAPLSPPEEGSYCLKCGQVTQWHPIRGCRVCVR
jgi:hypothetical protein